MKYEKVTQETVDEIFKDAKKEWDAAVKASGKPEYLFAISGDQWVTNFLLGYQLAKENVESMGFTMPTLVEGINVRLGEANED